MNTIKFDKKNVKMIAHRGVSGLELENTCSAFVAAGNRSYFGVETDVHVTADGQYIIFHDDSTGRIALDDMEIEKTTFETLRHLRLADRDGKRGRADLIMPTLDEYILLCKKYEKTSVLELKNRFTPKQVREIVARVEALGRLEQTIFISFELENLEDLREAYPEQPVQFLSSIYTDHMIGELAKRRMDLDILYTELTEERVRFIHENGLKLNCWTCDDPAAAAALADWGIDYITSNILE